MNKHCYNVTFEIGGSTYCVGVKAKDYAQAGAFAIRQMGYDPEKVGQHSLKIIQRD